MKCVELCNIHFCCAFIFCQPMKKFEFFGASRATRQRHFKTSSTGDENGRIQERIVANAFLFDARGLQLGGVTSMEGKSILVRQVFFAGHIPQVTTTGHSIFAPKQHKKSLNSANRTRQALMHIFSKNMFRLGAQLL